MKTAKYFDVHDKDVTPAIYTLLFSDIIVEKFANDQWYCLIGLEADGGWTGEEDFANKLWKKRLERNHANAYHDREAMKRFLENPCSFKEAIDELINWLKERGVDTSNEEERVFVKVWW